MRTALLRHALIIANAVCLMLGSLAVATADNSREIGPSPQLGPADVVRIQLQALADNNNPLPNAGIEQIFRFASPGNRQITGPLDRFTLMVNREPYRFMLNHREAEVMEPVTTPQHVLVPVRLTTDSGRQVRFLFVLSEQDDGPCRGCWMTDAVIPVGLSPTPDQIT